jgi:hypothetical protein
MSAHISIVPPVESDAVAPEDEASFYFQNPNFNEQFDADNGPLTLAGYEFSPSLALFRLDEDVYGAALAEWQAGQEEELIELVTKSFPTPIALSFRRMERGCNNDLERLRVLKDVWEAVIFVLHALVVAEARCRRFPLAATLQALVPAAFKTPDEARIKEGDLLSDSIHARLNIIRKVLVAASEPGAPSLHCASFLSTALLDKLTDLNSVRNGFSHDETESVQQAREVIGARRLDVLGVLDDLRALSDVTLLFYESSQTKSSREAQVRGDVCRGHAYGHEFARLDIDQAEVAHAFPHFAKPEDGGRVLAHLGGRIVSLAPFVHFVPHNDGHEWRLCLYKKKHVLDKNNQQSPRFFDYAISGLARPHEIAEADFQTEMDELRQLITP